MPLVSAELDVLDQLQGGDLPLAVIRQVFPDDAAFIRGIFGLLAAGDVRLLRRSELVAHWEWWNILSGGDLDDLTLSLTEQGAARIA